MATNNITLVAASGAAAETAYGADPSMSADGRYIAIKSYDASDGIWDVILKDMVTGASTLVSSSAAGVEGNAECWDPSVSADGRYVAFTGSANNLVAGDSNLYQDVFLKDTQTGAITRLSTSAGAITFDGGGVHPTISADGRYVIFTCGSTQLFDPSVSDILLKDTQTGAITLVSTDASGAPIANGSNYYPGLSADGRYAIFTSYASNLVAGDTNGANGADIFRKDLTTGAIQRVNTSAAGEEDSGYEPTDITSSISADGRYVLFSSTSRNLVPGDGDDFLKDVFLKDMQTGAIELVSASASGVKGNLDSGIGGTEMKSMTPDARFVVFISSASNLVAGDTNGSMDVFIKDTQTGAIRRVSTSASGTQANSDSFDASISSDGQFVVFASYATNLVSGTSNVGSRIYRVVNPFLAGDSGPVESAVSYTLAGDETALTLTGSGNINGTGNSLDNTIIGNAGANTLNGAGGADRLNGSAGNDTLDGGVGNDTTTGGSGNDVHVINADGDVVVEAAGGGTDLVKSSVTEKTLSANVENLTLTGAGHIGGTGNTAGNTITGNNGDNVLNGKGGADKINGGGGNDTLVYGAGDILNGAAGLLDTLKVTVTSVDLSNNTANPNTRLLNFEQVDLKSGAHTLKLAKGDVLDMSSTSTIKILGDSSDTVNFAGTQVAGGTAPAGFTRYTIGSAILIIDSDVNVV